MDSSGTILLLTTGGTIGALPSLDPIHPPEFVIMPPDGRDIVREIVESKPLLSNLRCLTLDHSDSKHIDEVYRRNMCDLICAANESQILITHGTDTILKTANFLFHQTVLQNSKNIILVGAMTPLANGPESDGFENMAFAYNQLTHKSINTGVHIVLSDYDAIGAWKPHLYRYIPDRYEKLYDSDGRRSRLIQKAS